MKSFEIIFYAYFLMLLTPYLPLKAQDSLFVRKVIGDLTAPNCAGRGYNGGIDKAADLIAENMKKFQLQPLQADKYPKMPFTANEFWVPANNFRGKMAVQIKGKTLSAGDDFLPHPASKGIKGTFKVKTIAEHQLADDAFFEQLLHQTFKPNQALYLQYSEKKAKLLADRIELLRQNGIAKLLLRPVFGKLTWHISSDVVPCTDIQLLTTDSLPQGPKKVKIDIDQEYVPAYLTRNLMGIVRGSVQPDTFVVFTAHYDHLGQLGKDKYIPGANDNASGTAMLLDLAQYYAALPQKPYYSMAFVAFSAEELGLIGSQKFVEAFATDKGQGFDLSRIKFLVNLDLVGTGDEGITVVNATEFEREFQLITTLNKQYGYFPQVKARGKAANSDHYPFYEKGVRCFFIYTLGGIKAYHDIYDRAETLPLTRYKELFALLTQFVGQLQP